jgi:hypothetical protein
MSVSARRRTVAATTKPPTAIRVPPPRVRAAATRVATVAATGAATVSPGQEGSGPGDADDRRGKIRLLPCDDGDSQRADEPADAYGVAGTDRLPARPADELPNEATGEIDGDPDPPAERPLRECSDGEQTDQVKDGSRYAAVLDEQRG